MRAAEYVDGFVFMSVHINVGNEFTYFQDVQLLVPYNFKYRM